MPRRSRYQVSKRMENFLRKAENIYQITVQQKFIASSQDKTIYKYPKPYPFGISVAVPYFMTPMPGDIYIYSTPYELWKITHLAKAIQHMIENKTCGSLTMYYNSHIFSLLTHKSTSVDQIAECILHFLNLHPRLHLKYHLTNINKLD